MKYISTRGQAPKINFSDTLITGLASDGGLYLPENYPQLSKERLEELEICHIRFSFCYHEIIY